MNNSELEELASIRRVHADLYRRMDALGARIDRFGEHLAHATPAPPELPPGAHTGEAVGARPVEPPPLPTRPLPIRQPPPLPQTTKRSVDDRMAAGEGAAQTVGRGTDKEPLVAVGEESLEMRIGQVWLVRVGILIVVTGLVFLGNYAYREFMGHLGAGGRLFLLYLAGAALGGLGLWLGRRGEHLLNYGRVLMGGGLAVGYYATYAAHFVAPLQVIGAPVAGGVLLLIYGIGAMWVADRMRSQVMAVAMVALAFYASAINPVEAFTLYGNLLIAAGAVGLMARHGWSMLTFVALVGTYGAHLFWRFTRTGALVEIEVMGTVPLLIALVAPAIFWVLFAVASLLRCGEEGGDERRRVSLLTINNGLFFATILPVLQGTRPEVVWFCTSAYGLLLMGIAVVITRSGWYGRMVEAAWLMQGLVVFALGLAFQFTGYSLAVAFALQVGLLVSLSGLKHGRVLVVFAMVWSLVAAGAGFAAVVGGESGNYTGLLVGALLVGCGGLAHRRRGPLHIGTMDLPTLLFSVLGFGLAWADVLYLPGAPMAVVMAVMVGMFGIVVGRFLRMLEWELAGHGVMALTYFAWWSRVELWEHTAVAAMLVFVGFVLAAVSRRGGMVALHALTQLLHGLGLVMVVNVWSATMVGADQRSLVLCGLGLVVLTVGLTFRSIPLAAISVIPAVWGIGGVVWGMATTMPWESVLIALVLFFAQSIVVSLLGDRVEGFTERLRGGYRVVVRLVTVVAGLLSLFRYGGADDRFLLLAFAGSLLLAWSIWVRRPEAALYAAIVLVVAGLDYLVRSLFGDYLRTVDLLGWLAVVASAEYGRIRMAATGAGTDGWFSPSVRGIVVVFAALGFWATAGGSLAGAGVPMTAGWSLIAVTFFAGGCVMRERVYRLLGLGILGSAVVRVVAVDVWGLEPLFRIISFLVLGVVLLLVGFIYNRYAGAIRKWL